MFLTKPICPIILEKFSTTLFSNVLLLGAFTLDESDVAFGCEWRQRSKKNFAFDQCKCTYVYIAMTSWLTLERRSELDRTVLNLPKVKQFYCVKFIAVENTY